MPVGRKPKPAALKQLEGNPGKRPINLREPQPTVVDDLTPPSWLDAVAKRCWRDNAPELQRIGLLTKADVNSFSLYCQAFSRYRQTLKTVKSMEPDHENYRQIIITLEKAEASLRLFATDFGMNPSARSRLSSEPADKPEDPFESWAKRA